ncbi:MAG: helix-turn-helix domain-containing protein, partial [Candidatus Brocadiia bacterium]|nr:helix-turn-helix domain-containing protein [Candidatus Brocadiia bacterium]
MNAAPPTQEKQSGQWVGLGGACGLLGVNESTLRHWADAGWIRTFRTVGGHRRFAREDIVAFQERGGAPAGAEDLGSALLKRLRRRLHSPRAASHQLDALDERGRGRLRVLGRRLVELALQYHQDRRRRPQLLEDARFIGEEYAAEFARQGISLPDALGRFVFHRSAAVASVRGLLQ